MKFYFCETCGKRITDGELEEGSARNKQLKGIYCEDCALGVSTNEFEPIKLTPSKTPDAVPIRRPTPSAGAASTPKPMDVPSATGPRVHKQTAMPLSQKAMLCGAGVIVVLGLVMLVVGLNKRNVPNRFCRCLRRMPRKIQRHPIRLSSRKNRALRWRSRLLTTAKTRR